MGALRSGAGSLRSPIRDVRLGGLRQHLIQASGSTHHRKCAALQASGNDTRNPCSANDQVERGHGLVGLGQSAWAASHGGLQHRALLGLPTS